MIIVFSLERRDYELFFGRSRLLTPSASCGQRILDWFLLISVKISPTIFRREKKNCKFLCWEFHDAFVQWTVNATFRKPCTEKSMNYMGKVCSSQAFQSHTPFQNSSDTTANQLIGRGRKNRASTSALLVSRSLADVANWKSVSPRLFHCYARCSLLTRDSSAAEALLSVSLWDLSLSFPCHFSKRLFRSWDAFADGERKRGHDRTAGELPSETFMRFPPLLGVEFHVTLDILRQEGGE